MDSITLLNELDEMIARIERMNAEQMRRSRLGMRSVLERRVLQSRQSRLWWLRRVRAGVLAMRPEGALLH